MLLPEPKKAKRGRGEGCEMAPNGQKVDNSLFTLQKLFALYQQAELCDVQLQVADRLFHVHKLILSMSSDVFKTMLTDWKWPDAQKSRIVLNEEPECVEVFGEFLEYMYTGSIHLNNISVLPLLTLADKYNIHDLCRECKQYIATHCHASLPNLKVVSWLHYAILCNDRDLELVLQHYILLNFTHVIHSEDFLTMNFDVLKKILNCQQLVIKSEYALFTGLKKWLLHNDTGFLLGPGPNSTKDLPECRLGKETKPEILNYMQHLMSLIRFLLIKPAILFSLPSDQFIQRHKDFFIPRLEAALNFQRSPHFREWHSQCYTADNGSKTRIPGSRCFHTHCLGNISQTLTSSCTGSRTRSLCNSDTSIIYASCSRKGDFTSKSSGESQNSSLTAQTCKHSQGVPNQCGHLNNCLLATSSCSSLGCCITREICMSCTPRNYTCDDWSLCLTIENFATFPRYGSRTYFFSTPACSVPTFCSEDDGFNDASEALDESDDSAMLDWQAELYPKGVQFPRAKMIGIPNNYDIEESSIETVRLAVHSKTVHQQPCRVSISVLAIAAGLEDGSEYVETLAHKMCIYDKEDTVHNIDSIVPLGKLTGIGSKYLTGSAIAPGTGRTCFKLVVIIKPV